MPSPTRHTPSSLADVAEAEAPKAGQMPLVFHINQWAEEADELEPDDQLFMALTALELYRRLTHKA